MNAWSFLTLYLFYLPGLINTFPLPGETKTDREQTSVAKLRVNALSAMTDNYTGPSSSVSWLKKSSVFYFICNLIKWPWEFKLVLHYLVWFPAEWLTFEKLCQMTRGLDEVSCPGGRGKAVDPQDILLTKCPGGGVLEKYLGRGKLLKVWNPDSGKNNP